MSSFVDAYRWCVGMATRFQQVASTPPAGCVKPAARRDCCLPEHRRLATEIGWRRLAGLCSLPVLKRKPVAARRTRPKEFDPWPRVFNFCNPHRGNGQVENLPPREAGATDLLRLERAGRTSDRGSARAPSGGSPAVAAPIWRRPGRGKKRRPRSRPAHRRSPR